MRQDKPDNKFVSVTAGEASVQEIHHLLLGGVAPRPVALVSTISESGVNNLSPFSFYNAFGANPPVVVFSPSRRGRDGTTKDTLNNLRANGECVVHAVTYDIVQQVSLSSTEYEPEVDEFKKSGLTAVSSDLVSPMRVKESPFQMECKVRDIIPLGESKASGNLVICEVLKFHYDPGIFKENIIDPDLIDLVGRNSGDYYTRASGDAIFKVAKPVGRKGIGFDNLPDFVLQSSILSANNLGQLANCEEIPSDDKVDAFLSATSGEDFSDMEIEKIFSGKDYKQMTRAALFLKQNGDVRADEYLELSAKAALENNDTEFAWKLLLLTKR